MFVIIMNNSHCNLQHFVYDSRYEALASEIYEDRKTLAASFLDWHNRKGMFFGKKTRNIDK